MAVVGLVVLFRLTTQVAILIPLLLPLVLMVVVVVATMRHQGQHPLPHKVQSESFGLARLAHSQIWQESKEKSCLQKLKTTK
jgi:hypothetical protein